MPAAALSPPTSPVEAEVRRIRELLERSEFAAALSAAEKLLAQVPENRDVLYMLAVSQRYLERIPDALATLARFEKLHPDYSRLFQERGHCYVTLRSAAPAIKTFLRAVNLNPALPASWNALQILFRVTGQAADAELAASHVATLAALPVEVVTASSMFADGEIHEAERIIRKFLLAHGNHIEAMRLLAKIGTKLDVLDDAELLLDAVLVLAPDYQAARYDYVQVLLNRHKHVRALEELDKLLKVEPGNRTYRTAYATARVGLGDNKKAVQLYRELLLETPRAFELHLSIAHALKTLGRQDEAIESYRTAAGIRPSYGDAYWSLANLKTYRFADEEIARMRVEESAPNTALADRFHLCFALGKALEDRGEYAESFKYYERGNALKKAESRYKPEHTERNARLQASVCSTELFGARQGVGSASAAPIFIVGLPRSGSTLLEQILASHSQVEGTRELPDIPGFALELGAREAPGQPAAYPQSVAGLGLDALAALGERYLAQTRPNRLLGRPHFIDKMPSNFFHIGLIHLILPNARIIDARRSPLACCFANFKQHFQQGVWFTYSLEDIGHFYRDYVHLMRHFDAVLPGRIHRVRYENLVADLEGEVRRLLDYCGLPFEAQCLRFHETRRVVQTASSEQVRRPLYADSVEHWRNYEPWLGELKRALGDVLEQES